MKAELSNAQIEYVKKEEAERRFIFFARILIFIGFLCIWEALASTGIIDSFFYSSPLRILSLLYKKIMDFTIFYHIYITLLETIISFILINVISILVAIILLSFKKISAITEPYLVVLNALPKSALAPLIIVWLGTGTKTIIIAGISVAVFGSIMNLYSGFKQVDREKIKLIKTLGGTKKDEILKIIIPSSIPVIISNMKVNIGLALVGVIIGEFLAARNGLGYLIIYGSQVFQLDLLILSIVILCIIAMLLYKSISYLENKIMKSGLF